MIIGLTGKNASGKGEVADYLKTKGFVYYSLSDELREEATKRNIEPSRDNLTNLGNELRKKHGPNYLAQKILGVGNNYKHKISQFRPVSFFWYLFAVFWSWGVFSSWHFIGSLYIYKHDGPIAQSVRAFAW